MAPKIQVPADFGRNHIGAPAHGNLVFKLKDGQEIRANSIILSLNSPVIDDLTTNLHQQTLEADDFHQDAVDCFIEAAYTGELGNIKRSNFRDVNKMSHAFNVSWLSVRCAGYYNSLVDDLDMNDYEEILFVVEEARYARRALKKKDFLEQVVSKMSAMVVERDLFIDKYMTDFVKLSKDELDMGIAIAGVDVHVLVRILVFYIAENKENIDSNTRYMLENINLPLCFKSSRNDFESLFNALESVENLARDDFKMLMKLSKLYAETSAISCVPVSSTKIPNLFHSFDKFINLDFDELIQQLFVSEEVSTLYMFVDAVWTWFTQNRSSIINFNQELLNTIITAKRSRGWHSIDSKYLVQINMFPEVTALSIAFINLIEGCDELHSHEGHIISASSNIQATYSSVDLFFSTSSQHKFKFDNDSDENCADFGHCGIIVDVSPDNKNRSHLFDINLCVDNNKYPMDIHFHDRIVKASQIHLALQYQVIDNNNWHIEPLSWRGRPYCDELGILWRWGFKDFYGRNTYFSKDQNDIKLKWKCRFTLSRVAKMRFIAFINVCEGSG